MPVKYFHSVTLDEALCKGCTVCIKGCPTEAIRVQKGRAWITAERCIDCGECIRTCPSGAKKAISDPLSMLDDFDFKIAIPAPTLYGQFPVTLSCNKILTALKSMGFDDVFEVAVAAEILSRETRDYLKQQNSDNPLISSSCPVVVRLVETRFPSLIDQLVPMISPMELSARIVKDKYKDRTDRVGVFFISPCAAKVTDVKTPRGIVKSSVDGVIGIKDIFKELSHAVNHVENEENLNRARAIGISWARTDGEGSAVHSENHISVDGIDHVIDVLENLENGHIKNVDFVEMMSCPGGCVGGPLTVENPYIARNIITSRERSHQAPMEHDSSGEGYNTIDMIGLQWTEEIESCATHLLDPDYKKAMEMMEEMEIIRQGLPGLDCGSCGAPSCKALAEDIVRGKTTETDCVFMLREKIRELTREMIELESRLPPGLDR
ncbi:MULTISPECIES: [Fe-Fe] hydrogenase large subunit C-terminal domain-containing protein [unclassified Oceanispirochaeta]|uniref:[Fe-Fe] hydrogenase large subunit C-terminal domain-containing protein n=1 Tax=unclassified Oceanispirochaeta TaxID=2635722 RepID=UPI000E0938D2|nr:MULTISPECIES: [Fe-Fe] hydrogenase large subunit C-terminal domain-containing protein [unclassified Oceanispirochaeta]MBF9014454.1 4Fe-4S binding protein [Oceanispirochaeta sp. M2]NPD70710.1 4Fe-4S binding protein [Oceanispirochaeta sp. M1]RDG33994.1 4Fe-4S dicluster domain-containing protein [Oceanispirochaeta sp. M1]